MTNRFCDACNVRLNTKSTTSRLTLFNTFSIWSRGQVDQQYIKLLATGPTHIHHSNLMRNTLNSASFHIKSLTRLYMDKYLLYRNTVLCKTPYWIHNDPQQYPPSLHLLRLTLQLCCWLNLAICTLAMMKIHFKTHEHFKYLIQWTLNTHQQCPLHFFSAN